ncbi:MAG: hypothetical protein H7X94_03645 [Vallitaleaceae bacterium]|nr:hypothetical protein [Vallitaleaceae bacterium]
MTKLLEIKEFLINFYKKFEKILLPVGKFVIALITLINLNGFFGYNSILDKTIVNIALAALVTFIPASWFLLILIAIVSAQLMVVSIEATVIMAIAMLVVYLLFVRLFPKMAYFVIMVPICFMLKIGYIIPIVAGLFFGPTAIVSIATGVIVYQFANHLPGLLQVKSESLYDMPQTIMSMYKYVLNALTQDSRMILTILVFTGVLLVTYIVCKLDYDYVWYIAIGAGATVNVLGFIIGTVILKADISIFGVLFGSIVAALLVSLAQFMRFSLDYARAEKVQFEDDDYYYFVKALPKVKIAKTQKAIRKIR